MKYRYPKISNVLSFQYSDAERVRVKDILSDDEYEFCPETAEYVKKLDGKTHPYRIKTSLTRGEIDSIIAYLYENDLVRTNDIRKVSIGCVMRTVWIPRWTPDLMTVSVLINRILMCAWLPTLIIGIALFVSGPGDMETFGLWFGVLIGIVSGMFFHELGHAMAGISYGAHVFEAGVMIMSFIIPGAYVLLDSKNVKNRMHRIQITAAGVEMNFLLTGIYMLLAALIPLLSGMFLMAANMNMCMGALNLAYIGGFDGSSIISDLLGIEDFVGKAYHVVIYKEKKQELLRRGSEGFAVVAVCYIMFVMQIAFPVLLLSNVLEVFAWIF